MPKIREGVYFIEGRDEMIPDSHTYIIGKPDSKDLSMIDAGLTGKGSYKMESIRKLRINTEHIKRVIMTHTHFDHIGCLSEIRQEMPWIELWVHAYEAVQLEEGDERTVYGMDMFKNMCQEQYHVKDGAFKFDVNKKLNDGEKLKIGGMVWEVIHVPGHSAGSIALYEKTDKILISGDVVYADYAIGRFDLYGADPARHRESLMRLSQLEVDVLLPGHNRIMEQVPEGYIRNTAEQWAPYLV